MASRPFQPFDGRQFADEILHIDQQSKHCLIGWQEKRESKPCFALAAKDVNVL